MIWRDAATHDAWLAAKGGSVAPLIRLLGRDEPGEIHPGDARKLLGVLNGRFNGLLTRHNAAGLCALLANDASQLARIDVSNSNRVALLEKIRKSPLRTPAAGDHGAIANDESGRVNPVRLHVVAVDAGIADMRIRQRDDLATVGRIGKNLLITRHSGIEDNFADSLTFSTDRRAVKDSAIL